MSEELNNLCFGPPGSENRNTGTFLNRRNQRLFCRYWFPTGNHQTCSPKALVFLCHGFCEHLANYHSIGEALAAEGVLAFGHDHVGHGRSEGIRAYIDTVDEYVDDLIDHCMEIRGRYDSNIPLFMVAHSMGGMVAIRAAISHPRFFRGMVLVGPLVIPGQTVFGVLDFRVTPFRAVAARLVLRLLDTWNPQLVLGYVDYDLVTREEPIKRLLAEDELRWQGGTKVHLLIAFVNCLEENLSMMGGLRVPFLVLHGDNDGLCNVEGSRLLKRYALVKDKELIEFSGASHQLFLELPHVRNLTVDESVKWITNRIETLDG